MLTWRYHLLSLVAVFLALGLGVLVGVSLSDNGLVETGQAGLVSDIQRDVDELRGRNSALERDKATNLRFQDDTFPFIVGGHLQGRKIAIVASSRATEDLQRKVTSAVHGAGGQVVSTTVLNPDFDTAAAVAKIRADLKNDPAWAAVDESTLAGLAGAQITREVTKAGGLKVVASLQGILIESANGNYEAAADSVVFITRADDEQSPVFQDLEKQFLLATKDLGVMAVGCEPTDAPRSDVPLFLSVDVSSVDNLESRIGQVSLVYVLGGEKGAFGVKTTADMLIPILRTPRIKPPSPGG